MKIIKKLIMFIVLVVVLFFACLHCYIYGFSFYLPDFSSESVPLLRTLNESDTLSIKFAPVLDTKIDKDKNIIYCSTFQLMWKVLCQDVLNEPAQIKGAPEYVEKLNSLINFPANVSEDSYFAIAGFGNDTVKKINQAGKKKFPAVFKNLTDNIGTTGIISFSALYKNLLFEKKFENIDGIFKTDNKQTKIKSFGTKGNKENKYKEQVSVVYWDEKNPKEFIVKLKSKSDTDEIFISTLKPEVTLEKSYEKIIEYYKRDISGTNIQKSKTLFDKDSVLIVPKINFELTYNYKKLIGKELLNQKFKEKLFGNSMVQYYVAIATQYIKFDLNESGVKLYSTAKMGFIISAKIPLVLVVDGPFIIFLKEKNAQMPYFMAYIGNDELLVKR